MFPFETGNGQEWLFLEPELNYRKKNTQDYIAKKDKFLNR